jgi:hypothetical protein
MILFTVLALIAGISIIMRGAKDLLIGWGSLASAVLILVVGGSRGAILAAAFILGAWALRAVVSLQFKQYIALIGISVVGLSAALIVTAALPTVYEAFIMRFVNASQDEDTIQRLARSVLGFGGYSANGWGSGVGMHSNIGLALGSGNPWIEIESIRWVAELGIVGYLMAMVRVLLVPVIGFWIAFSARNLPVDATLVAAGLIHTLLFGAITTQPSTQGYFAILLALFLSARAVKLSPRNGARRVPAAQEPHG